MQKVECECGSFLKKLTTNHMYSKKHQRYMLTGDKSKTPKTKEEIKEYQRERRDIRNPLKQNIILNWSGS